jgi:alpha-beta hydrolase superfamily lysophospholipase
MVRNEVAKYLNATVNANPGYKVVVLGHSLGAAVATLAAADLRGKGLPSAKLYAFASPRVANSALASYITAQSGNYRFTHTNDPVPKLPLLTMGYVHISPEYYITAPNNSTVSANQVQVLEGEINWNGNTGTGMPSPTEFPAHHWYFEEADACKGPGLPLKI